MDLSRDVTQQSEEQILSYLLTVGQPDWVRLQTHAAFSLKWVIFFLKRSRPIPRGAVEEIYQNKVFRKNYQVNLQLLRCKSAPPHVSINLVHTLRWLDLFWSLRLAHLPGGLRHRIEAHIVELLPRLTLGERITLAKQAPRCLIRPLRTIDEPMVLHALLRNYYFTYEDALFIGNYLYSPSAALEALALCPKWLAYPELRLALLRHAHTPKAHLLPIAKTVTDQNLRILLKNPQLPLFNRRLIQRVLEERFCVISGLPPSELDDALLEARLADAESRWIPARPDPLPELGPEAFMPDPEPDCLDLSDIDLDDPDAVALPRFPGIDPDESDSDEEDDPDNPYGPGVPRSLLLADEADITFEE